MLNEVVIKEADRLAIRDDWRSVVPRRHVFLWSMLSLLAFCFMVSSVVAASSAWGKCSRISSYNARAWVKRRAKIVTLAPAANSI